MALVLTANANPGTATWVDESTLAGPLTLNTTSSALPFDYTSNVYWKLFITAGSLLILVLGLGYRGPVLVVGGGYSFFSKLTPYYWGGMFRRQAGSRDDS